MQLFATLFFAVTVPISAKLAEHGRRRTMLWITTAIGCSGWCWADVSGWNGERDCDHGAGLSLMGLTYGRWGLWFPSCFRRRCGIRQFAGLILQGFSASWRRTCNVAGAELWPAVRGTT